MLILGHFFLWVVCKLFSKIVGCQIPWWNSACYFIYNSNLIVNLNKDIFLANLKTITECWKKSISLFLFIFLGLISKNETLFPR